MNAGPLNLRHLVVVLGDQLDPDAAAFDGFDPREDQVWMAEVAEEATHVWSHKARIALFLAAMRHFAETLRARGYPVDYLALDDHPHASLSDALAATLREYRVQKVVCTRPGDYRVLAALRAAAAKAGVDFDMREDRHFISTPEAFGEWARGRRQLTMEYFYRALRRQTGYLMDDGEPAGGRWNFDADNRGAFDARGPGWLPAPVAFGPDALTRRVLALVEQRFSAHPGSLEQFDWPVTRSQALEALRDFITHRLPGFGVYQDALWAGEPWLYHSRLSAALNLKLLSPREVIDTVIAAYRDGHAPLAGVEGFVRQILGWREFVHGLYWNRMPGYLEANALGATGNLPGFYWTGDTEMHCLADTLRQTLDHGYAHHIQRLMVTGLFALLLGVSPRQVHEWYLAVYVDAVEWVELPNTLGMSQYADGGLMGSKPYVASGRYLPRMSNHCAHCPYDPAQRTGENACPFTTLYWDFLDRHRERFERHPRAGMQWRNLGRIPDEELQAIRAQAKRLRARLA